MHTQTNTHTFAELKSITHNSIIHSPVRISSQFSSVITLKLADFAVAGWSITCEAISAKNTHTPAVIFLPVCVYVHARFQKPLPPFRFRLHSQTRDSDWRDRAYDVLRPENDTIVRHGLKTLFHPCPID